MQDKPVDARIVDMALGLAAYGRHIATAVGGLVGEWNDVVICSGGYMSRYKNMVVPLRPISATVASKLADHLVHFYGTANRWSLWNVFPDDLSTVGFTADDWNPIMERTDERLLDTPHCPGLSVQEVLDDAGVRVFERTRELANGRNILEDSASRYLDGRVLSNELRLWIGYQDGQPVGTAALFEHEGISMVKNISTLPAFRGRGIGKYMSIYAINTCANHPLLDADLPARQLYIDLGFQQIGVVKFWLLN
jgi:GNAT superfamily N-acetyltransferase